VPAGVRALEVEAFAAFLGFHARPELPSFAQFSLALTIFSTVIFMGIFSNAQGAHPFVE
jgi:hypothetical protein